MKYHLICVFFLLSYCSCVQTSDIKSNIIVVDVAKDYPSKDIYLQDIAEVEYLPLATSDSMLVNDDFGSVSEEGIVIKGAKVGEILLFDRQGQKLQGRICKRGQGPEEYNAIIYNIVDWKRKEVFIADYTSMKVYDFSGKYLRTLINTNIMEMNVCDFNQDYLLCSYNKEGSKEPYYPYFIISKDNRTIDTLLIEIPRFIASNRKIIWDDGHISEAYGDLPQIFHCTDRIWLTNVALDTVFVMHPDQTLEPVMVPIHLPSTNEEAPLLFFHGMNDRYAWISRIPRHIKIKMSDMAANIEREEKVYMYDRKADEWFEPIYYNHDINNHNMNPKFINISAVPYGYGLVQLNAMDLIEAYNKNQIADEKLKKIASKLQEEDNPVLMILKFKN
ncbi:6-bladed beta-propeller [Parabacteroides bouchesdurhonensis]|uniref:6-bladed beta-propeller n=1 Tax=Parabacteroides bouchesdurhonensis TaxID=1936995 RepID=UPI000C848B15|nr:6-bladed beta-propeller [Parabacteroides bouchesdurhonensis]